MNWEKLDLFGLLDLLLTYQKAFRFTQVFDPMMPNKCAHVGRQWSHKGAYLIQVSATTGVNMSIPKRRELDNIFTNVDAVHQFLIARQVFYAVHGRH